MAEQQRALWSYRPCIHGGRLFRTKSCNGGSGGGDGAGKRPSGELAASAASLTDMGGSTGRELDSGRKPRLTRTQSAFSPVSFSPLFTDDISGTLPTSVLVAPMGSSLQSFPLPPPPPPHAPDAFPRIAPIRAAESLHSQPPQHLQCPLYRPDSSSFAASLRELEKRKSGFLASVFTCGWYWGPMNWEDAEMKLKGKPDGSFLVRDSSDPRYILSLSFRSQGITHHTRMEHYRGTFSLWCHPKFEDRCQSVVEFIKRAIMHSKNGKFLYFLRSRVPALTLVGVGISSTEPADTMMKHKIVGLPPGLAGIVSRHCALSSANSSLPNLL
ncbi:hypothetical protein CB1_000261039 [Camelus ferus]|nr:hypothetical protein CB1_000261039 [Camelus ferus]